MKKIAATLLITTVVGGGALAGIKVINANEQPSVPKKLEQSLDKVEATVSNSKKSSSNKEVIVGNIESDLQSILEGKNLLNWEDRLDAKYGDDWEDLLDAKYGDNWDDKFEQKLRKLYPNQVMDNDKYDDDKYDKYDDDKYDRYDDDKYDKYDDDKYDKYDDDKYDKYDDDKYDIDND